MKKNEYFKEGMFLLSKFLRSNKYILKTPVKTSQELRMLSSVTINCQVTKIVVKSRFSIVSTVFSVANVTSPYDSSVREHPKCQIITADQSVTSV